MKTILALYVAIFSGVVSASILPPNDLYKEDHVNFSASDITKEQFYSTIDGVIAHYTDVVQRHGGKLVAVKDWNNPTVNAYALRKNDVWSVNFFGGLARRPETTLDALALTVCHELGHHLAGFPYMGEDWASSEGQSDYFATQSCSRLIWGDEHEVNAQHRDTVNPTAKAACDQQWHETLQQDLCYRIADASLSLARLLSTIDGSTSSPEFETPDLTVAKATRISHPKAQCRLDNFLQGALCTINHPIDVIPGLKNFYGQKSKQAERESAMYTCTQSAMFPAGVRSLCWYKPKINLLVANAPAKWIKKEGDNDKGIGPGENWELTPGGKNESQRLFNNIDVDLYSKSPKLQILANANTKIGDIPSQDTRYATESTQVKIGEDAVCGEKLDYMLRYKTGQVMQDVQDAAYVGKMKLKAPFEDKKPAIIPNMRGTVERKLAVLNVPSAKRVVVDYVINFFRPVGLVIELISPNGKTYMLHDKVSKTGPVFTDTFDLSIDEPIEGDWTIRIKNQEQFDRGVLKRWSLTFLDFEC
ncbi:MAG: proprotein convertase P-domain-containing protein [Oligoflexales bacterium]